jgi:hypothetical protein
MNNIERNKIMNKGLLLINHLLGIFQAYIEDMKFGSEQIPISNAPEGVKREWPDVYEVDTIEVNFITKDNGYKMTFSKVEGGPKEKGH